MKIQFWSIQFIFLALILTSCPINAFIPGVTMTNYKKDELIPLTVNVLTSPESPVSYSFYHEAIGTCNVNVKKLQSYSLGAILFGDRIYNSAFDIKMLKNVECQKLCMKKLNKQQISFLLDKIKLRYAHNWLIDQLPVAQEIEVAKGKTFRLGFPLGHSLDKSKNEASLTNHYNFIIDYHSNPIKGKDEPTYRVVGARIEPYSLKHDINKDNQEPDCKNALGNLLLSSDMSDQDIAYTYSVVWQENKNISWATRWDQYIRVTDRRIHWYSLISSLLTVFFLTGMVAMILLKVLRSDIERYNKPEGDNSLEDYGWKLVYADVFRPPKQHLLFSVLVGSGAQLLGMAVLTMLLACLGLLTPSNRGALISAGLACYVLLGFLAGYYSARFYKFFMGRHWKHNVLLTATVFPGVIFAIYVLINLFYAKAESSGAVPFWYLFQLIILWFLVSIPLCFVGAYAGFRRQKIHIPISVNPIPRQIPPQSFWLRTIPSILLAGILPFGAISIEYYFIFTSIWFHRIYYVFGFLFVILLITIIICAETSILSVYFQLCAENHRWWWRAFLSSGSSAFYMFLASIFIFAYNMPATGITSAMIYLLWTLLGCFALFLVTGTIGFIASWYFVNKIYSSIKVD